ncbi:hypothetical protein V8E54_006269 [Elaphomyces granulatus]
MRQSSDVTGFLPDPVKGVSTAFAVLFTISSVLHIWQNSKYKSWACSWPLPCASIIITAGFICREITAFNPIDDTPVYGLLYSAVFIISFSLHLSLLHLLLTHPMLFPFRPMWLYPIIICSLSLFISLISNGASTFFSQDAPDGAISSGLALLKAGMVIQLSLNVAFIAIVAFFHYRCSSKGVFQQSAERSIKILIIGFYGFMKWIIICNIFSTVQIFLPSDSPVWTTEAYFWVFYATPMLICTGFLHILPPAKYIRDIMAAARAVNDFELGQCKRWC